MTERLYFADAKLLEFTGRVTEILPRGDRWVVVLDRTAFYPTGGGQPHDTGRLGRARVIEVLEDEASGRILHLVEDRPDFSVGDMVTGRIDRERRWDHMQQHTGQHILSQAFLRAAGAETKSFHLGARTATIDLDIHRPEATLIREAEELANQIVFEDRPVNIHQVPRNELDTWPIRRDTYHGDVIRVVEISDFDYSPCGGTHAARTGEVGLIAIRGWERVKKMCRVEFVCGRRALYDYRAANEAAKAVALTLSMARDEIPERVAQLIEDNKHQRRRIRELFNVAATVEAAHLLQMAESRSGYRLVKHIFRDRSMDEVRILAEKLCERGGVIALLGLDDHGAARLLFARSSDLDIHMGERMKEATGAFGGRGGGKPDMAQGGIPKIEQLSACLDRVAAEV